MEDSTTPVSVVSSVNLADVSLVVEWFDGEVTCSVSLDGKDVVVAADTTVVKSTVVDVTLVLVCSLVGKEVFGGVAVDVVVCVGVVVPDLVVVRIVVVGCSVVVSISTAPGVV